jgi:hypothetical protein
MFDMSGEAMIALVTALLALVFRLTLCGSDRSTAVYLSFPCLTHFLGIITEDQRVDICRYDGVHETK